MADSCITIDAESIHAEKAVHIITPHNCEVKLLPLVGNCVENNKHFIQKSCRILSQQCKFRRKFWQQLGTSECTCSLDCGIFFLLDFFHSRDVVSCTGTFQQYTFLQALSCFQFMLLPLMVVFSKSSLRVRSYLRFADRCFLYTLV